MFGVSFIIFAISFLRVDVAFELDCSKLNLHFSVRLSSTRTTPTCAPASLASAFDSDNLTMNRDSHVLVRDFFAL